MRRLLIAGVVIAVASCTEHAPITAPSRSVSAAGTVVISVAPKVDTLFAIGDTVRMQASVTVGGVPDRSAVVTWSTLNPTIASVSAKGTVKALTNGTARIAGTSQGAADTALITVHQLPVSGTVTPATLVVGDSLRVRVTWKDSRGAVVPPPVPQTFSSFNPNVVAVDSKGMMHALAAGGVRITARARETGDEASGPITVLRGPQPAAAFVAVHVGRYRSCGKTSTGDLYCWGRQFVGDGGISASWMPARVDGEAFANFDTGEDGTCAVMYANTIECWGDSRRGAIATMDTATAPNLTVTGHAWQSVVTAGASTCALTESGALYCWGDNSFMQANAGENQYTRAATRVGPGMKWASVDVGGSHGCGIGADDARAYCWGRGDDHRLGQRFDFYRTGIPVPVNGLRTYTQIAVGAAHACALHGGKAWCWGENAYGQLGNGTQKPAYWPVLAANGVIFKSISAGGNTTCGILRNNGMALCWGDNANGQLGLGVTGGFRTTASAVAFNFSWAHVDVGVVSTCGVTSSGYTYCWGNNGYGQVGDGTRTQRASPTLVANQP